MRFVHTRVQQIVCVCVCWCARVRVCVQGWLKSCVAWRMNDLLSVSVPPQSVSEAAPLPAGGAVQRCFRLSMMDRSLFFIRQSRVIKHDLVLVLSSRKCCGGFSLHSQAQSVPNMHAYQVTTLFPLKLFPC